MSSHPWKNKKERTYFNLWRIWICVCWIQLISRRKGQVQIPEVKRTDRRRRSNLYQTYWGPKMILAIRYHWVQLWRPRNRRNSTFWTSTTPPVAMSSRTSLKMPISNLGWWISKIRNMTLIQITRPKINFSSKREWKGTNRRNWRW